MDTSVPRPRFDIPYVASMIGGLLVCMDYVSILLLVPGLPLYALEYIAVGLALGIAMLAGAYLYKKETARRWLYLLMASSLLSLFLYVTILSSVGALLGSMAALYLLTRSRMKKVPQPNA